MLKVVIDTVVFVRSLINPHGRSGRIVFSHNKTYQLYVSEPIIKEILEVLHRPELTTKFQTLSKVDFSAVLNLFGQAHTVEVSKIPSISHYPKDNKFIATAREADAEYLVTEDKDLLDLKKYQGVKIIDTETFIRLLEEKRT